MTVQVAKFVVQQGLASEALVAQASAASAREGGDLITHLVARTEVDEATWLAAASDVFGHEAAPPGPLPRLTAEIVGVLPHEVLLQHEVFPLGLELGTLVVATSRKLAPEVERALVAACGRPVWIKVALELRIRKALMTSLGAPPWPKVDELIRRLDAISAAPRPAPPPPAPPSSSPALPPEPAPSAEAVDAVVDLMSRAEDAETILRALFDFSSRLFPFVALFGTSGQLADGKWAHVRGKGARELHGVQVPMHGQSVFAKAREKGAVTQAMPENDGFDKLLFSLLGHPAKNPVVVAPVIVRSRPIALVLGDPGKGGFAASTLSLLAAVTTAAGHQLERIIWRRKLRHSDRELPATGASDSSGRLPAPPSSSRMPDWGSNPRLSSATSSARGLPAATSSARLPASPSSGPSLPASAEAPAIAEAPADPAIASIPTAPTTAPAPKRPALVIAVVAAALLVVAGAGALYHFRTAARRRFDPLSVLEDARGRSGLGDAAKLGALRATVDAEGKVVVEEGASPLAFTFVAGARAVEVRFEDNDLTAGDNTADLPLCGGAPCVLQAPRPTCSVDKLWEEALRFGATKRDVAQLSLATSDKGAVWSFAVQDRGVLRIDDARCTRLSRSRLKPPARALPPAESGDLAALLPVARAQAGLEEDAELNAIEITRVTRDGRIELVGGDGSGAVAITFSDPPGASPLRRRRVTITSDGAAIAADVDEGSFAYVTPPKCTIGDVVRRVPNAPNVVSVDYGTRSQTRPAEPEWVVHVGKGGSRRTYAILDRLCAEKRDAPLTPTIQ